MAKVSKTIKIAVAAPVAIVVILLAAWGVSYWQTGSNVARNVSLAGTDVGGNTPAQLDRTIEKVSAQVALVAVQIRTPAASMDSSAGDIGVSLDPKATRKAVMAVGRSGSFITRPTNWIRSFFSTREVPASLDLNIEVLSPSLVKLEGDKRVEPVDPKMEATEDAVTMVAGKPGSALTVGDVVKALPSELATLTKPIKIDVKPTQIPTSITDAEVQSLVDSANKITESPLTVTWGDKKAEIPGKEFRPAFVMTDSGDGLKLSMDPEKVSLILVKHTSPPLNPTNVKFDIVNGVPTPVGGSDAQVCCGDDAPNLIVGALLKGEKSVALPFRTVTAAEGQEWAAGLGVKEVIGSFTTRHACCQSRVTNIHRISDIMRGTLIAPGDTMSVNSIVGRRTTAKGFVSAGVILEGKHTEDIGGGVSQFATTTFNAAFFSGLEIPAYQSHSEWLSRYPFGREATLWYPGVDLKVKNNTPYGVVVWPTYTDTSVTVQMWSTKYVSGDQTAQIPTSGCGKITTTRTRTWVDGRTENDKFFANYRCG